MATEGSPQKIRKLSDAAGGQAASEFDKSTQKALDEIDNCQNEIDTLNERASEEIVKVEQKYNKLRKPLFEKRSSIISGIPNFWITAILNHPDLNVIIDENEEDCLQYLIKLEVEEFEDIKSGYRIKFHFNENPYFENSVITKEFHLGLGTPTSQSTQINWKEGCRLNHAIDKSSTRNRKRRFVSKSFFSWFSDNMDPTTDDIAEIMKDDLWHNPLQYYLVPDIEEESGVDHDGDDNDDDDFDDGSISSAELLPEDKEEKLSSKGKAE